MGTEDMITIPRSEYNKLTDDQHFLSCLEALGVDNWCGYGEAQEMFEEEQDD